MMAPYVWLRPVICLVFAGAAPVWCAPPIAIEHVGLIDGTGRGPQPAMTVVVEADRITAVGPDDTLAVPSRTQVSQRNEGFFV